MLVADVGGTTSIPMNCYHVNRVHWWRDMERLHHVSQIRGDPFSVVQYSAIDIILKSSIRFRYFVPPGHGGHAELREPQLPRAGLDPGHVPLQDPGGQPRRVPGQRGAGAGKHILRCIIDIMLKNEHEMKKRMCLLIFKDLKSVYN